MRFGSPRSREISLWQALRALVRRDRGVVRALWPPPLGRSEFIFFLQSRVRGTCDCCCYEGLQTSMNIYGGVTPYARQLGMVEDVREAVKSDQVIFVEF